MATIILNEDGLAAINESYDEFQLGADISWDNESIPYFYGSLDGKGYKISGTMGLSGLIARCENASISNIIFENCSLSSGESNIGICCGFADGATFSNLLFKSCTIELSESPYCGFVAGGTGSGCTISQCSTDSSCSITGSFTLAIAIGMIVGELYESSISQCAADGVINITSEGDGQLGGIAGRCVSSTIEDCYNHASITGTNEWVIGGITSTGQTSLIVTNCYNIGTLSGAQEIYGICNYDTTSTSCYWLSTCGGSGGEGASTSDENMKLQGTYTDWNFSSTWIMATYPRLLWTIGIITTLAAKYITKHSAIIGGEYTANDDTEIEIGIQWKPALATAWTTYWWAKSPYYISRDLIFWYAVTGLNINRTYNFRAFYRIGSTYIYGSTLSFTTDPTTLVFPPGYDYRTAKQALDDVVKIGVGRYYADGAGNFQYESRLRRNA